jgi:hypothetical protein
MFSFWVNTKFIDSNYLCFEKSVLDGSCKDKKNKHFQAQFKVEIFLNQISDNSREFKFVGLEDGGKEDNEDEEDDLE